MNSQTVVSQTPDFDSHSYAHFLDEFKHHFRDRVASGVPVYTTVHGDLYEMYLSQYPVEQRQTYRCRACEHFIKNYGGLVTIDEHGIAKPLFWSDGYVPAPHTSAIATLRRLVAMAPVKGVFLSDATVWGHPRTGEWTHLAVVPPTYMVYKKPILSAAQKMAEKREDYRNMAAALHEWPMSVVSTAVKLLEAETLYQSEKVLGVARWLQNLLTERQSYSGRQQQDNLLWRAVATAPEGFCHPRSSMVGTLLEDIASGMTFDTVKTRFDAKMHPLRYARPQAPPSSGNIAQAEKIVEKLGASGALQRRFATLDDLETLWTPRAWTPRAVKASKGVFGNLKPKGKVADKRINLQVRSQPMTCTKFLRTVVPTAETIEVMVPLQAGNWTAYVTAADFNAPPILQWDHPDRRNPVSWYLYAAATTARDWNLVPNTWCPVDAIIRRPPEWYENRMEQFSEGMGLILRGAKDTRYKTAGVCLFPSLLKSEFHSIRSTIEAYSKTLTLSGFEQANACGLSFDSNTRIPVTVRVLSEGMTFDYTLDRWD